MSGVTWCFTEVGSNKVQLLLYFSLNALVFLAQDALPTQNVAIWHSGNETQQSAHFLGHLGTARTNPTDSTFKFNHLCITLIWHELQLALHINGRQKSPSEGNFLLSYCEYISKPVLYYFHLSKEVESVLLLLSKLFLYISICTST